MLRKRRLLWARQVFLQQEHHSQYIASLFGQFSWETTAELEDGIPHSRTIAPLVQLYTDLRAAYPEFAGFHEGWERVLFELDTYERVLRYTTEKENISRPHPDVSRIDNPEGFVEDVVGFQQFVCPECSAKFVTWQEELIHRRKQHGYKAKEGDLVLPGNKCPWCLNPFADRSGAIRHIRSNSARAVCRLSGGPSNSKKIVCK